MVPVVVAMGANLGDARATLERAVQAVSGISGMRVRAVSPLVETDPVGGPQQPAYLNAVLVGETTLAPEDLLDRLHEIEGDHGRTREVRWGARTLDLDIIQVGTPGSGSEVRRDDAELTPAPTGTRARVRPRAVVAGRPVRDTADRRAGAARRRPGRRGRHERRAVRSGLEPGVVSRPDGIRARVLVAVAVIVAGASRVVLKLLADGGRDLPVDELAGRVHLRRAGAGSARRRASGEAARRRPGHPSAEPLYAARVLAMAQAAASPERASPAGTPRRSCCWSRTRTSPLSSCRSSCSGPDPGRGGARGRRPRGPTVVPSGRARPAPGRPGSALRLTTGHDALEHVAPSSLRPRGSARPATPA